MKAFTTIFIWFKLGFPLARALYTVFHDGKVTKQEVHTVIDQLLDGREEVVLWKPKSKPTATV